MWRHLNNQYYVTRHWEHPVLLAADMILVAFVTTRFAFRNFAVQNPAWRFWVPSLCLALMLAALVAIVFTLDKCFDLPDCLKSIGWMVWLLVIAFLGLGLWVGYAAALFSVWRRGQ